MTPKPRVRVAAAVIWREDRVLLTQRPPGGARGLQWEFPGGKLEPCETFETAVVRELNEELGVAATAHGTLAIERHDYPDGLRVEIGFVKCSLGASVLSQGPGVHAHRWVRPDEVDPESLLEADRGFIRALAGHGAGR